MATSLEYYSIHLFLNIVYPQPIPEVAIPNLYGKTWNGN